VRIVSMSQTECKALLKRVMIGRLASSLKDQPYVVPICFAYIAAKNCLYLFSTVGQKIKWMRKNPKVCFQADEIGNRAIWASVVVNGKYVELKEPKFTAEKQQAIEYLAQYSSWWRTPLAQRREKTKDLEIEPVFFRIDISSISGLRASAK
jgi:nitroimidazol reductase NimA-like FMN-containing flavoprotein (pyridoxamine 5'-phosphate oxidase superfamily)